MTRLDSHPHTFPHLVVAALQEARDLHTSQSKKSQSGSSTNQPAKQARAQASQSTGNVSSVPPLKSFPKFSCSTKLLKSFYNSRSSDDYYGEPHSSSSSTNSEASEPCDSKNIADASSSSSFKESCKSKPAYALNSTTMNYVSPSSGPSQSINPSTLSDDFKVSSPFSKLFTNDEHATPGGTLPPGSISTVMPSGEPLAYSDSDRLFSPAPSTTTNSARKPMPLQKAGDAILAFGTARDMPLVELGDDGKYKLMCKTNGTLKTIDPKTWRTMNNYQRAAIYRLREEHAANQGAYRPRAQPTTATTSGGTGGPPPPPSAAAPLPPLASGGFSQEQISAMMKTMKRNHDQQAANIAQIMTSMSFLVDALKNQVQDNKGAQEFEYSLGACD